jgi:hypothetical protein
MLAFSMACVSGVSVPIAGREHLSLAVLGHVADVDGDIMMSHATASAACRP